MYAPPVTGLESGMHLPESRAGLHRFGRRKVPFEPLESLLGRGAISPSYAVVHEACRSSEVCQPDGVPGTRAYDFTFRGRVCAIA
jgi:hypothetical protein